jgi:uncharacterized protein involved in type VI secretion and phage assembly
METPALEQMVVELAAQSRERFYGKYRGVVSSNDDRENLGRLRAKVPEIYGEQESPWALPCAPYAGRDKGWYAVPAEGSGVWIEFEAGDPSRPIWVGGWWARNELPQDQKKSKTKPPLKIMRTEQGLVLAMDDDKKTITLSDSDGKNFMTIEVNRGLIKLQATTKVVVEAPQIELVEGATHPLVFGDDLLQYLNQLVNLFNAHLHPGETVIGIPVTPAPPVAPFPPATPALLSVKVKTG